MMSIIPTFSNLQDNITELECCEDEKPDEDPLEGFDEKQFLIFLVDRSGSMSGSKMDMTK